MPTKMRTTRNLLLMATLLGSALFAGAAEKRNDHWRNIP